MGELTLYKEHDDGNTVISNCFIDHYLTDANDAQIKVYLYLLRTLGAGQATSVSAIADRFNHTEKDILRSLTYWEQKGLLSLDKDSTGQLCGIRMISPKVQSKDEVPAFHPDKRPRRLRPARILRRPARGPNHLPQSLRRNVRRKSHGNHQRTPPGHLGHHFRACPAEIISTAETPMF